MSTAHIEAKKGDIAKTVLMPGDPLRAKYIADNFLVDVKIVNTVRNMFAYTGYYNNKRVTIFPSGMGIPSIGIYAYELYNFYEVDEIIRIGTCGTNKLDLKLLDLVLATSSYSFSTFPMLFGNDNIKEVDASLELNDKILSSAKQNKIDLVVGKIVTSDVFDVYIKDIDRYTNMYPNDDFVAKEMEAFCLFYLAKKYNKKAACLLSIVDIINSNLTVTSEDREKGLKNMIKVALDAII